MEFKGRKERTICYEARDAYFNCSEKLPQGADAIEACKETYDKFEKACGLKWTEHFLRKRDYTKFKEKLLTEGVEALDTKIYKNR